MMNGGGESFFWLGQRMFMPINSKYFKGGKNEN